MTSIRHVAEKAGVSISTVSHVLNNTRFVSEETRNCVLAAVEELGYLPNRLARSLRIKEMRTEILGLLIPDNVNPFYADVSRGVEDASFEENYSVILCNFDGDPVKESHYVRVLLSRQVDGLVLVSPTGDLATLELIDSHGGVFAALDFVFPTTLTSQFDSVAIDNVDG